MRRWPGFARQIVFLVLVLLVVRAVEGDWEMALRITAIALAVGILPGLITRRLYPRIDGVRYDDSRYPRHSRAFWVELALAVVGGALVILIVRLMDRSANGA